MTGSFYANGELEREIVLSRVIDAPPQLVYRAWIEPQRMFQWFGPRGFRCEVREQPPAKVGAQWRFDMIAPDGQRWDSRMTFLEIIPNEKLVLDHGSDQDDDPSRFRMTVTFDKRGADKTLLTLRQIHPSKARRAEIIEIGAVELGYQTLDKLNEHLARG